MSFLACFQVLGTNRSQPTFPRSVLDLSVNAEATGRELNRIAYIDLNMATTEEVLFQIAHAFSLSI